MNLLEEYCKNCGSKIDETQDFCPECGTKIPKKKFCQNCGSEIENSLNFCENCGTSINNVPKMKISKKQITIILLAIVIIVAIIASVALFSNFGKQIVEIEGMKYSIPADFKYDASKYNKETYEGITTVQKYWYKDNNYIEFNVMYSDSSNYDPQSRLEEIGDIHTSYMGKEGYYNELSNSYAFTFVENNRAYITFTTDPNLFKEIEVV